MWSYVNDNEQNIESRNGINAIMFWGGGDRGKLMWCQSA